MKSYLIEKAFPVDTIPEEIPISTGISQRKLIYIIILITDKLSIGNTYIIPLKLRPVFGSIKEEFSLTFNNIRGAIKQRDPPLQLDELKQFLKDGYSHLESQIVDSDTIDEILDVVNKHCTVIDMSCLKAIVRRYNIENAEEQIQKYNVVLHSFCKETKACLCLGESFSVTKTPLLQSETAIFVLNWDPLACTLEDIKEIVSESLGIDVQIRYVQTGTSIIITCFFPLHLMSLIIAKAKMSLELLKKKKLMKLTIGYCVIYHERKDDVRCYIDN